MINILEHGPNDLSPPGLLARLLGRSDIFLYGTPYMRRYRFFNAPRWLGGWGIRVHHILRSDLDRDLHDHPFSFWSFIVAGPGYVETTVDRVTFWPRFSLVRRRAEDLHRLHLVAPVWTIVIRGPVRRAWGFRRELPNGAYEWVHWKEFIKSKGESPDPNYVSTESMTMK